MKRQTLLLTLLSFLLVFSACQREYSLESSKSVSQGSLRTDGAGDCLPKNVAGAYEEGLELDPAVNYIEVDVNVLETGTYVIATDTVNGIYFQASGLFTTTGIHTIRLPGTGTPVNSGMTHFVVNYDSTVCVVTVTVLPEGGGVPAELELEGSPTNCIDYVLEGTFITGTALTSDNKVTLKVNVITPGTYSVTTTLSNGITFSGAGTLGTTGAQTITLTASGTPLITGPTNIPVTIGNTSCSFSVDVVGPAVYTVDCGSAVVDGTYIEGIELDASHEVTIEVNVTTAGGYNITGTINGMTFAAAGDFASTGTIPVTLIASGIPANEGNFNVQLTGGSTPCSFPVTVEPPGTGVAGSWQFTAQGTTYSGTIVGLETDASSQAPYLFFYFYGANAAGDLFDMILADANTNITNGDTYNFGSLAGNSGAFLFTNGPETIEYAADPSITGNTLVAIVNTHNTAASPKIMTGTFSGMVMDQSNTLREITGGQFVVNYP